MHTLKHTFLAIFATVLLMFSAQAQDSLNPYELLWEIRKPGVAQPSYLFGTMHVTDARAFNLPDSVLLAIQNTPGFALEVDFDSASYYFFEYMYALNGESLFDESTWEGATSGSRSWGGGRQEMDFDPSELFKLVGRDKSQDETAFLDAFLYRLAREQGKVICGLEEINDQLRLLGQSGDDEDDERPKLGKPKTRRTLIDMYSKGDLRAIETYILEGGSEFFQQEVIARRNHGMATRFDSLMRLRPTFVGVGAAHLPGREGVIALLRDRGYTARPVVATFGGLAAEARARAYVPEWTEFASPQNGYALKVPAKPYGMDFYEGTVKMYMGMDFPGGMVYGFYAVNLPEDSDSMDATKMGEAVLEGFSTVGTSVLRDTTFSYGGVPARETIVRRSGEILRIRLLFREKQVIMLLLGNSKKVVESQAAEDWFASLELMPPQRLTEQPRRRVTDARLGISLELPVHHEVKRQFVNTFMTGGPHGVYTLWFAADEPHTQGLKVMTQDYADSYLCGSAEERIKDCVEFLSHEDLEELSWSAPVTVDGVEGRRANEVVDELRFQVACFSRNNRLTFVAFVNEATSADSGYFDTILSTLRLLPLAPYASGKLFRQDSLFEAKMDGKPIDFEGDIWANYAVGRFDSIRTFFYHNPQNSLNTSVDWARVWKYYSGDNRSIYTAIVQEDNMDAEAEMEFPAGNGLPANDFAGTCKHVQLDTAQGVYRATYVIPAGEDILIGRVQVPRGPQAQAQLDEWFASFHSLVPPPANSYREQRFSQLVADLKSPDTTVSAEAESILENYILQPRDYALAKEAFLAALDTVEFSADEIILNVIMAQLDSSVIPLLKDIFTAMPKDAKLCMDVIYSAMLREEGDAHAWAVDQLLANPGLLDRARPDFSMNSYFADDTTGARLRKLLPLLDQARRPYRLLADACAEAYEDERYFLQADKILRTCQQAVDAYVKDLEDWQLEGDIYLLMDYLSMHNVEGWIPLANRLLEVNEGYLPAYAYMWLSERGPAPRTSAIKRIMGLRYARATLLAWLLDQERGEDLPGKFKKPEFIGEVSLEIALDDYPSTVELVEKRRVYFEGEFQYFFVYRFAYEGERDWTLGFGGPVPMDHLPANSYFHLAGSDGDIYKPSTYKKKVKKWLEERIDE